jgi:Family of unknown function (DUF5989)
MSPTPHKTSDDFARQAAEPSPGLLRELADFLIHNKAWWLTPIVVVLLLVGLLIVLGSTGLAPFIYPLF